MTEANTVVVSRRPVGRARAGQDLGLLVVSFGVTVVVTRLYLMLSGYPQVGGGTYHIAHALWGGLLLIVGSMLPLLWGNRWALTLAALCSGVGVGLFIDEVGKYITTANNYFFPLAAPIIYLAFLAVLAVARWASQARRQDARAQTYVVLEQLTDTADGAVTDRVRRDLLARLEAIEAAEDRPDLAELAARLRPYVDGLAPSRAEQPVSWRRLAVLERRLLPKPVLRVLLVIGSFVVGTFSMIGLVIILALTSSDPNVTIVIDDKTVPKGSHPPALWAAAAGETVVGVLLLSAAVLLALRRDRLGTAALRLGVLIGLAAVNVVLGYVSAELVVIVALLELIGLGLCVRFRQRFLGGRPATPALRSPPHPLAATA